MIDAFDELVRSPAMLPRTVLSDFISFKSCVGCMGTSTGSQSRCWSLLIINQSNRSGVTQIPASMLPTLVSLCVLDRTQGEASFSGTGFLVSL